jgi:hypothetical protein
MSAYTSAVEPVAGHRLRSSRETGPLAGGLPMAKAPKPQGDLMTALSWCYIGLRQAERARESIAELRTTVVGRESLSSSRIPPSRQAATKASKSASSPKRGSI